MSELGAGELIEFDCVKYFECLLVSVGMVLVGILWYRTEILREYRER